MLKLVNTHIEQHIKERLVNAADRYGLKLYRLLGEAVTRYLDYREEKEGVKNDQTIKR